MYGLYEIRLQDGLMHMSTVYMRYVRLQNGLMHMSTVYMIQPHMGYM